MYVRCGIWYYQVYTTPPRAPPCPVIGDGACINSNPTTNSSITCAPALQQIHILWKANILRISRSIFWRTAVITCDVTWKVPAAARQLLLGVFAEPVLSYINSSSVIHTAGKTSYTAGPDICMHAACIYIRSSAPCCALCCCSVVCCIYHHNIMHVHRTLRERNKVGSTPKTEQIIPAAAVAMETYIYPRSIHESMSARITDEVCSLRASAFSMRQFPICTYSTYILVIFD